MSGDWTKAFLPMGSLAEGAWIPHGAGVLLLDSPVLWLVAPGSVLRSLPQGSGQVWVPRQQARSLFDLGAAQANLGLSWVLHPRHDLAATMFPVEASFDVKGFPIGQCTMCKDLQATQPVLSVGCIYGPDVANPGYPVPAYHDGILSRIDAAGLRIYTSAVMYPRNSGGPLVYMPHFGGTVSLLGLMLGNVLLSDADPRALPLSLGTAVAIDAAWDLLRSEAALAQRQRVLDLFAARKDAT